MPTLEEVLSDGYCAKCDSFGNTNANGHPHLIWCNVCWDWATKIPRSVETLLMEYEEILNAAKGKNVQCL